MNPSNEAAEATRRSLDFERYVLTILRAEAIEQNKPFQTGNELDRGARFADAVAPQGLFDLSGPTFVEVRYRATMNPDQVAALAHRARLYSPEGCNILFVFYEGRAPRERLLKELKRNNSAAEVKLLDKQAIDELARKHPDAALAFNSSFLEGAINTFKERDERKQEEQQEAHVAAIRAAYEDDRLALFLGAGVSKSANFPDWSELVKRISLVLFDKSTSSSLEEAEKEEVYRYFQSESPSSPIIVARLLQNSLKGNFPEIVRATLYGGTSAGDTSEILREIGALCLPRRGRVGVSCVVNYNFDDLLETELDRRGIQYRVIVSDADEPSRNELPIYHVHGFLPRLGFLSSAHRHALVFSEDAYHEQFHDPYLWTNVTQLNVLRTDVCLFIGVSLTDPNQRRLLEITVRKKSNSHHYAIMRDHWTGKDAGKLSGAGRTLAKVFKGLEESTFASLGISVLWVKEYSEVEGLLSRLRG